MTINTATLRRVALVLLAAVLPLSAVACSSDDDSSSGSEPAAQESTTAPDDPAASTDDQATDDGSSGDDTSADADDGGQDDSEEGVDGDVGAPVWNCETDPENLSGSSTILFAGDVDFGPTEADITPETTATLKADGSSLEPAALKVEVNTMFAIEAEDELGIDGVIIGCAGAQPLSSFVPATFLITEPGTYPVSLEVAGHDIGTIVVE